ncbi:hypothetical protein [Aureitalea marina]|uniref:TonB C-terminal domain-containing protein n=1 Tax=Aureitalea marina TaxID=930804 RepID=A0A2S7KT55_9FLAO|nr:hypothetical protein [Aureitalea marina]PQB05814.1 hypothetical protein BST85_13595 [Aureitalea marina]
MNFNYSYRAFLIASLLVGNLVLLLVSIKLRDYPEQEEVAEYDIEYIDIPEIEEEEQQSSSSKADIRTNRAYNADARFIAEAENDRQQISESTQSMLNEMNEAIENSSADYDNRADEVKQLQQDLKNSKPSYQDQNNERNTTLSYQLKDRRAVALPNPVYTCEGFGKVVISIVVDGKGEIRDAKFNPTLSTTTNQCLIDSALDYAHRSIFSKELSKEKQLGTISYNFPGQD